MKHLITIEIPAAKNEAAALTQLRKLASQSRLGEFVVEVKAIPEPADKRPNPMLRPKSQS